MNEENSHFDIRAAFEEMIAVDEEAAAGSKDDAGAAYADKLNTLIAECIGHIIDQFGDPEEAMHALNALRGRIEWLDNQQNGVRTKSFRQFLDDSAKLEKLL